eukprot:3561047-Rhodomonas_salina.1
MRAMLSGCPPRAAWCSSVCPPRTPPPPRHLPSHQPCSRLRPGVEEREREVGEEEEGEGKRGRGGEGRRGGGGGGGEGPVWRHRGHEGACLPP